jgi:transposase
MPPTQAQTQEERSAKDVSVASRGPPFVERIRKERPDKTIEIWLQDECRIGQQGTLTRCWAPTGSRPTAVKQTEYEWIYLFGAVNPLTGASSALLAPTVNTDYMNHHLRFISEQAGSDVHVILVLDQAGWHVAKTLKVPENISLLHLPAYSPELNSIERLWAYFKSHYLSNRAYTDYKELLNSCRDAWNKITTEQFCTICNTKWIPRED